MTRHRQPHGARNARRAGDSFREGVPVPGLSCQMAVITMMRLPLISYRIHSPFHAARADASSKL